MPATTARQLSAQSLPFLLYRHAFSSRRKKACEIVRKRRLPPHGTAGCATRPALGRASAHARTTAASATRRRRARRRQRRSARCAMARQQAAALADGEMAKDNAPTEE